MTTEGAVADLDQPVTLTPEQEAAEDAAFEAGFTAVNGPDETTSENDAANAGDLTPENTTSADAEAARLEAEAAAAAKAQAEAQEAANAPVTITKSQFDRLMAIADEVPTLREQITKTHDSVSGRIGSLKQTIDTLKEKAGRGSIASIKSLKRLEEEFPQLASLLKDDLSDAFGAQQDDGQAQLQPQATQPAAPVNPLEAPEVQEVVRTAHLEAVEAVHPGFRQLAATPEFAEWTGTLPAAAVNLLNSSWDSKVMVPAFNDFKKWQQQKIAAQTSKQQSDKRLAHAITPTDGAPRTGQHVVDEDAAFNAGFNRVRKR